MAICNRFECFMEDLAHGKHNVSKDTLKVMLSNTQPLKTDRVKGDITEIATVNGYPAGGAAITVVSSAQVNGAYKFVAENVLFTAKGGSFGPYRFAVIYNAVSDCLIGWYDYNSSLSTDHDNSFLVQFNAVNGIFQLL